MTKEKKKEVDNKEENFSKEYIEKLNNDLDDQTNKAKEYFENLQRSMAEFDNFKKRMEKEKQTLYSTVMSDVILSILPVLDNFEKAVNMDCEDKEYKSGIEMIYNSLKDTLKNQGLEEIDSLNKTFDPIYHEAVMHEENKEYGEKEIIEVLRKGYAIGNRVIRHSMVKVAN